MDILRLASIYRWAAEQAAVVTDLKFSVEGQEETESVINVEITGTYNGEPFTYRYVVPRVGAQQYSGPDDAKQQLVEILSETIQTDRPDLPEEEADAQAEAIWNAVPPDKLQAIVEEANLVGQQMGASFEREQSQFF
jgi:hypothetical protein